jgi:hypothetical protein
MCFVCASSRLFLEPGGAIGESNARRITTGPAYQSSLSLTFLDEERWRTTLIGDANHPSATRDSGFL